MQPHRCTLYIRLTRGNTMQSDLHRYIRILTSPIPVNATIGNVLIVPFYLFIYLFIVWGVGGGWVGVCAACWTHFTCHHELWPISVSRPFSFLSSSLGLVTRKSLSLSIDLFFKSVLLLFEIAFLILCVILNISPSPGWVFIAVCGSVSV